MMAEVLDARPAWVEETLARIGFVREGVTYYNAKTPQDFEAVHWDETQRLNQRVACKRTKVAKLGADGLLRYKPWLADNWMAQKWVAQLEQNQLLASCCRHPENHEIGAFYSSDEDQAKGVPDIYIFFCTCGRMHRKFCVGGTKGFKTNHLGEVEHEMVPLVDPETGQPALSEEGAPVMVSRPVQLHAPRPMWMIDGK